MEQESYFEKGRLVSDLQDIAQYKRILDADDFKADEAHWRQLSKNTISLFQVLIDQDLSELVKVIEHYPRYTSWVCDHFRYAYSYSENDANIDAASLLLQFGEPYFSKQFVRNVVRKLPKVDELSLEEIKSFCEELATMQNSWHPVIIHHYLNTLNDVIDALVLHPLQRIALTKSLNAITMPDCYEYEAEDRDAVLDIPYMN